MQCKWSMNNGWLRLIIVAVSVQSGSLHGLALQSVTMVPHRLHWTVTFKKMVSRVGHYHIWSNYQDSYAVWEQDYDSTVHCVKRVDHAQESIYLLHWSHFDTILKGLHNVYIAVLVLAYTLFVLVLVERRMCSGRSRQNACDTCLVSAFHVLVQS